jgi:hypothetical protein
VRHPVLDGLEDAARIINGVFRIEVKPAAGALPSPLTLVPSYPDLPMEDVYPRVERTDTRELYLREAGRGRVVYVPWDIDRTFWEVMCVDHLQLLKNAVRWAANEPPPVEVDGPGMLDVTAWRQRRSMTVHLVNFSNPMMMRGPLREAIPIGPLAVRIRLPEGVKPSRVHLLTAGTTVRTLISGNVLAVTVPSVDIHEVVAIDF